MKKEHQIDSLLEELLKEYETPERPQSMADFAPVEQKPVSVDQAIDQFLVQYERQAIPSFNVYEQSAPKLESFLFEQGAEDEEEAGGGEDEGGLDLDLGGGDDEGGGGAAEGGDTGEADAEGEDGGGGALGLQTPTINLQAFCRDVSRLVSNVNSLIDLQSIILNRAESYVANNYDQRTAEEFVAMLDTQYDLRPTDTEAHREQQQKWPPVYVGTSGPSGG